ncbi:hypothetical protein [Kitasatospora sp. NPDC001095]
MPVEDQLPACGARHPLERRLGTQPRPPGVARDADYTPSAHLLAALFADCLPCVLQWREIVLGSERLLVADLIATATGPIEYLDSATSLATRQLREAVRQLRTKNTAVPLITAVDDLSHEDLALVLDDALRHYRLAERLAPGADWYRRSTTAHLSGPLDSPAEYGLAISSLTVGSRELPLIYLVPKSGTAGVGHLRDRCRWSQWVMKDLPALDTSWQVFIDTDARDLVAICQANHTGLIDVDLWYADRIGDRLPDPWLALMEKQGMILLCGPVPAGPDEVRARATVGMFHAVLALPVVDHHRDSAKRRRR